MIIFDLVCEHQHRFEGWFQNKDEYETQLSSGLLMCPLCNSDKVHKTPTASHINFGKQMVTTHSEPDENVAMESAAPLQNPEMVKKIHEFVRNNFDDVGTDFVNEAKRIHNGETEERNIRGTASLTEMKQLQEEGIPAIPLPKLVDKDKLN